MNASTLIRKGDETSGAVFSNDMQFRYALWRKWDNDDGRCLFIMLNPSTADERRNDPTVERCQRRAAAWGYGSLGVCNIFALRATNPVELYRKNRSPVGEHNDFHILSFALRAQLVVCGWGQHGNLMGRGDAVLRMLWDAGVTPHALRRNIGGTPGHPLYIPYLAEPTPMRKP